MKEKKHRITHGILHDYVDVDDVLIAGDELRRQGLRLSQDAVGQFVPDR